MNPEKFALVLAETLEDVRLSRGERHVLKELLVDADPSEADRAAIRNRAFEAAQPLIGSPDAPAALRWLHDVIKALDTTRAAEHDRARAYFSPGDDCREAICAALRTARKSVDICVFTITDDRISREILAVADAGVNVRVISDDEKSLDLGSDVTRLQRSGISVAFDRAGHMHHKFALFDSATLINGSYNWTRSAASENCENVVVTHEPALVVEFQAEFNRLWDRFS